MRRGLVLASVLFLVASADLRGQWSVEAGWLTTYDANSFRNFRELPDWVNQGSAAVSREFSWSKAELAVSYDVSGALFHNHPDRRFLLQSLGGEMAIFPGGRGFALVASVSYGRRDDVAPYTIFDHRMFEASLGYRTTRGEWYPECTLGYANRSYPNLPEFSHHEWDLSFGARHSFPQRLSIILGVEMGYRAFVRRLVVITRSVTPSSLGSSNRRKMRRWSGGGFREVQIIETLAEAPETALISGRIRLGRPLGESTGLSLECSGGWSPSRAARSLTRLDYGYDPSDFLSEDPFSFDGGRLSLELRRIWGRNVETQMGFAGGRRMYGGVPAFDLDGEKEISEHRIDTRVEAWLSLQIPVNVGALQLVGSADLRWTQSRSNDPYYRWRGLMAGLGVRAAR
ncbi:MAG: hypothetical protein ONB23_10350 [candidate division KSB1 bacterium]|nr:hypothetical protein [candidate division KSB1 bacterium]